MVRPACFGRNNETAASNEFQNSGELGSDIQGRALREFDALVSVLRAAGVQVLTMDDTLSPRKPDAIFPNNWFSTHADGTLVLYPMLAPNRRLERREADLSAALHGAGFRIDRIVDLSYREAEGKFLEGTGSVVLDRPQRIAYACLSPRTDMDVLAEFSQRLDYELVTFEAQGPRGLPVYHTNVMLALGPGFAVLCAEALPRAVQRAAVAASLSQGGHEVIEIASTQMAEFAGNLISLEANDGPAIALSARAWSSLDTVQRAAIARCGRVITAEIPTIENVGGGSLRCMLAENFLPPLA
jgi:hypothetical protein